MKRCPECLKEYRAGSPKVLFTGVFNLRSNTGISYDVAPSGDRFLMLRPAAVDSSSAQVRVVLNWAEEVRRQVAAVSSAKR